MPKTQEIEIPLGNPSTGKRDGGTWKTTAQLVGSSFAVHADKMLSGFCVTYIGRESRGSRKFYGLRMPALWKRKTEALKFAARCDRQLKRVKGVVMGMGPWWHVRERELLKSRVIYSELGRNEKSIARARGEVA